VVLLVDATTDERTGASTLEVTHDGDERSVAEIVTALAKVQIPICAVEPEAADLERIFMDVTDRTAREWA
jgi:hypothetical protein